MIGHLKREATVRLVEEKLHPFLTQRCSGDSVPTCWAKRGWKVFLDTSDEVREAIAYVQDNPVKEGKRPQRWRFIVAYVG